MLYDRLANPDILTAKTVEQNNENTVFVGNIPFEASEVNVREFFSVCGAIHSVHMPQGKKHMILLNNIINRQEEKIYYMTFCSQKIFKKIKKLKKC